jgi:hypothetical protein
MYDKILQEDISESHRPLALKVLRWLAVSYRPLKIEEISEVCTIPPESELGRATMLGQDRLTVNQLLNLLPNLVVLGSSSRAENASLALAHFSVREYLTRSQLLEFPSAHFRIKPREAHRLVAKECLAFLYLSREIKSHVALANYAFEHWQLHAVTTGELDEDTRRNAFFLTASIVSGELSTLKKELPEDFARVTQWLEDPKDIYKLILTLRGWHWLMWESYKESRLALLYPQDGDDHMIRCRVHAEPRMYAPSYAVHMVYASQHQSRCTQKISVNDRSVFVTDDTYQALQSLRQDSTTIQLIYLESICRVWCFD